jgi:imidazole glycerol-phosphate synthase subunit HisH
MIGIIDYGLGNVLAFCNMYERLNIAACRVKTETDLERCTKLVLPGVGAFDHAMTRFEATGLREPVAQRVLEEEVPLLGVCVGMQMLAKGSEEGAKEGLGWIDGIVRRFEDPDLQVPHMGWNDVRAVKENGLLDAADVDRRFYFLHSYYFDSSEDADVLAVTGYGDEFSSAVNRGHIFGVQFHPEKSHSAGRDLLKKFAEL